MFTKQIPDEAAPQHIKDYLQRTGRKRGDGKKLVGALSAQKLLLYVRLLHWYVEHGAVIKAVYRMIHYQATEIFTWFVEQVTEARCTRDADKSKALLAEVFKLLGNSGYGKLIEVLERQTSVTYTKDEKVVDRVLRSAYFSDLDELGQMYELESRMPCIMINRLFKIGIAVYQLAKQRMLEFYYVVYYGLFITVVDFCELGVHSHPKNSYSNTLKSSKKTESSASAWVHFVFQGPFV